MRNVIIVLYIYSMYADSMHMFTVCMLDSTHDCSYIVCMLVV